VFTISNKEEIWYDINETELIPPLSFLDVNLYFKPL